MDMDEQTLAYRALINLVLFKERYQFDVLVTSRDGKSRSTLSRSRVG